MPATKSASPGRTKRSGTPGTSRTSHQPDTNEEVQYPQMDPMKDLEWVTAPLASVPTEAYPAQPKPGTKVISIVKKKAQPPPATVPQVPPTTRKGKGKSRSPSRKGKGRGGKGKSKGKRGTQHFSKPTISLRPVKAALTALGPAQSLWDDEPSLKDQTSGCHLGPCPLRPRRAKSEGVQGRHATDYFWRALCRSRQEHESCD